METRSTGATNQDKDLFVTVLCKLLRPISDEVVGEVLEAEKAPIEGEPDEPQDELCLQDFVHEVHARILGRLYDMAQGDGMLSMALIPLMAHLKKMPKEKSN